MKNKILIYFPDTSGYNFTPPYELLFQAKALQDSGFEIILTDARTHDFNKVIQENKEQFFLVIISTLIKYTSITITRQYPDGLKAAEYVKKKSNAPVLWTGLAASILTERIIEKDFNDFILTGISDNKIRDFVDCLKNNKSFDSLPSLVYKVDGKVFRNKGDQYYNSLKDYGDFKLEDIDLKPYIHNHTLDYIASTGCVNSCSFCSVPNIYNRHWHHNSVENITTHLAFIFRKYKEIKIIHFRDDNFFVNKTFISELFQKLKSLNIQFDWSAQTSVNILKNYNDKELISLRNSGCRNISIGIESGDNFILKKATKWKTTKAESIKQIKRLIKSGITVSVTSIISFPYNKGRDFNKTLRFLMKLKLLYPQLSLYCTVLQPIPGTEIFDEIFKNNTDFSDELLSNNYWTSSFKKMKLKKFETFYFIFDRKDFYKNLPVNLGKDLKMINIFFSPFIKLRLKSGCTWFLWEYQLTKKKIKKIKRKHEIATDSVLSDVGIRHLTSNYNYGFKKQ